MNPATAKTSATRSGNLPPAPNLFRSMISSQIAEKKPAAFAMDLAHEVRNPLTNINLAVEMMRSSTMNNDQQLYLDIIMRSSIRITTLVTDLLKSQKAQVILPEKHSIHQLLDEVVGMAGDRITLKNISVTKEYNVRDFQIELNRAKMKIALTNIIINAIDAMGCEQGHLKIITKSVLGTYVIQIEDNGCGISKKNLKHIFTPYFSNKPGGLGVGLSTTFDILHSNSIAVQVKSEVGKGTRFILLLGKDKELFYSNK